jgi:hypothetical protein
MNIFVTDDCPIQAARNLCDKHVRAKMQVEGSIMLAHAFPQEILNHPSTPRTKTGKPRRSGKGYFKHQCSIWARETTDNFTWLVDHTLEQFRERMYRWPQSTEHFTKSFIEWCSKNIHNTIITKSGLTKFAVAINTDCKCRQLPNFSQLSVIDQYRAYINHDKDFAVWTKREKPDWINNPLQYDHLLFPSSSHLSEHLAA